MCRGLGRCRSMLQKGGPRQSRFSLPHILSLVGRLGTLQ
ncbi:unnamed protein product [Ixodes pacificus]